MIIIIIIIVPTFLEVMRPDPSPRIWKPTFSLPKGRRTEKGVVAPQQSQVVGCYSVDITESGTER